MRRASAHLVAGMAMATVLLASGACAPEAASRHTIEVRNFEYSPVRLEVMVGDTVEWINRDVVPHTATDSIGRWDSGNIDAGSRGTWVATTPGRFAYLCTYHPDMRGVLVVGGLDAPSAATARVSGQGLLPARNGWKGRIAAPTTG